LPGGSCSLPGDGSCGLPGSGGQARRSGQHAHGKGAGSSQARWAWGRRRQGGTSGGKAGVGSPEARRREGKPTAGCARGRQKKGRHVGELAVGTAGAARAGGREAHEGEKNRMNRSFSTNQWHWWVISPNSRKLGFGGVPLEALHENHGVGGLLHLFYGADPRWSCWSWVCLAEKIWSGVDFLDLELRGALPNTP
jgi:hypothetical protein